MLNFNGGYNLLTVAYLLSPTDEKGVPKKEGTFLTSANGSPVKSAVNLDTGAQDHAKVWHLDGAEMLGRVTSTNNTLTFLSN